ncbi:hypothetical protein GX408_04165 [bacterium]|nr:hypothetical protein [bacterium]
MRTRQLVFFFMILSAAPGRSQDFYAQLAEKEGGRIPQIKHGDRFLTLVQKFGNLDLSANERIVKYEAAELPALKISVVSKVYHIAEGPVLQHDVELSSSRKMTEDLTVFFPVGLLERLDRATFPLKNGLIGSRTDFTDNSIAGYRCAGRPEKHAYDLALPLVLLERADEKSAVMTDPFFTALFDRGAVRWTYPKEVGFEDAVEKRTIIETGHVSDMDSGMSRYYQTILKEVPPGPEWIKDIAMIGYDYMSDQGRGWYADIDTLVKWIPPSDRHKVALCLHGWYDIVGRYCYNEQTGRLDETWINRIRGMELSLADIHHRITYARDKGFVVLMYFADGLLSSKGLPGLNPAHILEEGGWNGPDVIGGPYKRNPACPEVVGFYKNYARALFAEFASEVSGFVWDETFYIQAGMLGARECSGYVDRAHMRLIKEIASILHTFAPGKAFFTSDDISDGSNATGQVPPYALLADGCYQDSGSLPSYWSYGIFPNYRNMIWSCNWQALTHFNYTVFGVYAYRTPVVITNGWGDDRGFSEMTEEEKSAFINLFNYRKQFRTDLKGLTVLPPYFELK